MSFPSGVDNKGLEGAQAAQVGEGADKASILATAGAWLSALRPHQWAKNGFLFAPLVFSKNLFDPTQFALATAAFFLFSLTASSVYLVNDVLDRESDRKHPVKRHRPIASGRLSENAAWATALILAGGALGASLALGKPFTVDLGGKVLAVGRPFTLVLLAYLAQNALYSLWLKRLPWVDVFVIALGFVLRVLAGAVAISVAASPWLFVCTFALALYLALGKRKHEILAASLGGHSGTSTRKALSGYQPRHLNVALALAGGLAVLSYLLYTLAPQTVDNFQTHLLALTLPFPAFGVWRFGVLVSRAQRASSPTEALLTDPPFLANLALWLVAVVAILYWAWVGV